MKHNNLIPILLATSLFSGCSSVSSISVNKVQGAKTQLTVDINGVESAKGQLLVYLHDNSASYYSDDDFDLNSIKFFKRLIIEPQFPFTQVIFENIPAGNYAVSVIHDEDKNGTLSRMIFPFAGMPSEPYGLSNDIYSNFTKGPFEDALIQVTAPDYKVSLTLNSHLSKMTGL
ncbi:DUF2141 domain-containing protein [Pseudoalteromonas denitrificans]|uniref:Uncharacterized conserved protein, DUF2141 family n=1 Tax=Pseudoalteromonas denitrificans DSM 6059 TaxID=1123010 RepID=A0A1I1SU65_9GAMM|nr:DUF2141 domain-containing protein [Pseudoalteromonas denitrificans]SFD50015.1 Uncharacterized conserved protein, DUF2141 family [Pseudoalteromonas denitrificans DSM 6059]